MKLERDGNSAWFWCPGCDNPHRIVIEPGHWTLTGTDEKPTVTPSILCRSGITCHSFIREGKIQFLNDCSHSLAGQTVELGDFDWP